MCCLHIDTPGVVDIFIFFHLTGAIFCDIMISQMRMGTNGHNNTLWRFIVPYTSPFVNGIFNIFPGIAPVFLYFLQNILPSPPVVAADFR